MDLPFPIPDCKTPPERVEFIREVIKSGHWDGLYLLEILGQKWGIAAGTVKYDYVEARKQLGLTRPEGASTELTDARVEYVRKMIVDGRWKIHRSKAELMDEWGISSASMQHIVKRAHKLIDWGFRPKTKNDRIQAIAALKEQFLWDGKRSVEHFANVWRLNPCTITEYATMADMYIDADPADTRRDLGVVGRQLLHKALHEESTRDSAAAFKAIGDILIRIGGLETKQHTHTHVLALGNRTPQQARALFNSAFGANHTLPTLPRPSVPDAEFVEVTAETANAESQETTPGSSGRDSSRQWQDEDEPESTRYSPPPSAS